MNGNTSKPFNKDLALVKALDLQNNVIEGFYVGHVGHAVHDGYEGFIDVNPYTICRNSGIKDKDDCFIFEYDLLRLTSGLKSPCYGFLVFDEFYKSWKIRRRTDRTAYINPEDWTIDVIGNIILNDADAEIIYKQEKEEDEKQTFIDNSYCPSKFKK